jgi:hypothetical protein
MIKVFGHDRLSRCVLCHSRTLLAGIHSLDQRGSPMVNLDARQKHSGMTAEQVTSQQNKKIHAGSNSIRHEFDRSDALSIQTTIDHGASERLSHAPFNLRLYLSAE